MPVQKHAITVAVDVFRGVATKARGNPATIVAVGAAAAVVAVGAGVGYAAYSGAVYLKKKLLRL